MYVKINRDVCDAHLAYCERCLGQFLREPLGYERHCFEELVDDGSDILTLELCSGDNSLVLKMNEEQRKLMGGDGWTAFVDFIVPMYRSKSA